MNAKRGAICCIVLLAAFFVIGHRAVEPAAAAAAPPHVNEATVATLVAGEIVLTGDHLGVAPSTRNLRIDYEALSATIDAASPWVSEWSDTRIRVSLPPEIHSGQITVTVDSLPTAPVALLVYMYTSVPTGAPTDASHPLALALGHDGKVWVNEEFHTKLKWLSPATPSVTGAVSIPQSVPPGIFAQTMYGDTRSPISVLGEDITVAADGAVWFTEGGASLYAGPNFNSSRIIRFDPATSQFTCYNAPIDSSEVEGLLLDPAHGMVWYAESALTRGNAISGFYLSATSSDCGWDPAVGARSAVCPVLPEMGCHRRYSLPRLNSSPAHLTFDAQGNIWFTEFWANRLGRLDPNTGQIVELPLPAPIVRQGPGIWVGSGPWQIEADGNGDLWVSEMFDAKIMRVRPSLMTANDCSRLAPSGNNPCIEQMFGGSDGMDGNYIHSVTVGSVGRVWFALGGTSARIGFVDTQHANQVVLLPPLPQNVDPGGIRQDPVSGDVWFAEFTRRAVGRLQLASGDADGVPDQLDNCPTVYNPGQENADADFIDLAPYGKTINDMTWPNSDKLGDACDADADNDGLSNADELALAPGGAAHARCPSATAATDPLKLDTDGDGYADGGECLLGTDPASAVSKPPVRYATGDSDHDGLPDALEVALGTNPFAVDSDQDGVSDGVEVLRFATNPLVKDTDHDGCSDGKEIASVNGDRAVTVTDLLLVARATNTARGAPGYVPDFDFNRDGVINVADVSLTAAQYGAC